MKVTWEDSFITAPEAHRIGSDSRAPIALAVSRIVYNIPGPETGVVGFCNFLALPPWPPRGYRLR